MRLGFGALQLQMTWRTAKRPLPQAAAQTSKKRRSLQLVMGVDIEVHDCLDGPEKFPPQVQTTFGHRQPVNILTLSYQRVTHLGWSIYVDDGEGGKLVKTTERKHRSEPEKRQQVGKHLSQAEKRREVLSESFPDTSTRTSRVRQHLRPLFHTGHHLAEPVLHFQVGAHQVRVLFLEVRADDNARR